MEISDNLDNDLLEQMLIDFYEDSLTGYNTIPSQYWFGRLSIMMELLLQYQRLIEGGEV